MLDLSCCLHIVADLMLGVDGHIVLLISYKLSGSLFELLDARREFWFGLG